MMYEDIEDVKIADKVVVISKWSYLEIGAIGTVIETDKEEDTVYIKWDRKNSDNIKLLGQEHDDWYGFHDDFFDIFSRNDIINEKYIKYNKSQTTVKKEIIGKIELTSQILQEVLRCVNMMASTHIYGDNMVKTSDIKKIILEVDGNWKKVLLEKRAKGKEIKMEVK